MSEFVERIIEEKGEEIKKESIERLKRVIEDLKEKAKIVLPVSVIDILAKGGEVEVVEHNVPYDNQRVDLEVGGRNLLYQPYHEKLNLKSGKYRVILIIERIGEAEKDC